MNEITTLFTAIGDFFTKSDWSETVKWPFWILLFTIAAGGIYCARFGKKTLVNQGIIGALNLVTIYLGAVIGCINYAPTRELAGSLPFLSVTDQTVALVDPLTLELADAAPVLLKLMIQMFLIVGAESFRTGGKTLVTWFLSEFLTIFAALSAYAIVTVGISFILPGLMGRFAIIPVVLFLAVGILMLCAKFIFSTVVTGGNPYFSSVYKFFTVNRVGSLFTVSALSFLLSLAVLAVMHLTGTSAVNYADANGTALWIILALLLFALYIFGMFFHDKKKA